MSMQPVWRQKYYRILDWVDNMKIIAIKSNGRSKTACGRLAQTMGAVFLSLLMMAESWSAEQVRINFRDADIRSVIESVAEITGKSFVLDPRVKGEVTIIAPEPIDS